METWSKGVIFMTKNFKVTEVSFKVVMKENVVSNWQVIYGKLLVCYIMH